MILGCSLHTELYLHSAIHRYYLKSLFLFWNCLEVVPSQKKLVHLLKIGRILKLVLGSSKRNFKISSIFLWKILIFAVSVSLFTHWLLTIVCYWSFQFASRVKYLNMLKLCHFMTFCFLSPQVVCEALKRNWSNLFSITKSPRTKIIIVALPHAIKFTGILFILIIQVTEDKLIATCLSTNDQISLQFAFSLVFRQPLFLSPRKWWSND